MAAFALIVTLLLSPFAFAQNNTAGCYYYDGTPAPKLTPCLDTSGGDQSTCCSQGSICWSNGVCQVNYSDSPEDYLRDGCTDKTWKSPNCPPRQCSDNPSNAAGIRPCGGISTSNRYCCAIDGQGVGNYDCCNDTEDSFTLAIPTVITTIGVGPATARVMPISDATATSTPPESITSLSGSASATVPSSTPMGSASPTPTPDSQDNTGLKIGVGVGVGVGGLFLIAFIAMLIWYLRNRRKLAEKDRLLADLQSRGSGIGQPMLQSHAQSQYGHGYYSSDLKDAPGALHELPLQSQPHEMPAHASGMRI